MLAPCWPHVGGRWASWGILERSWSDLELILRPFLINIEQKMKGRGWILEKSSKTIGFCWFFENPASAFHLLFDVDQTWAQDKLQIAPRTLQDAPRCPTASNMGPTWAQHGPNMGPTWGPRGLLDRSKGGQIALPRGSAAPIAVRPPT